MDMEKFEKINSSSFQQMSTVLSMFLDGKEVSILSMGAGTENWSSFVRTISGNFVLAEISFSGDIILQSALLIKVRDAAIISNLIMGSGAEAGESISEVELTTVQEVISQMLSSYTSSLSSSIGKKLHLTLQNARVYQITPNTPPFSWIDKNNFVLHRFVLKIDTIVDSEIYQILPASAVLSIIGEYGKEEKKAAETSEPLFDIKSLEEIDFSSKPSKPQEDLLKVRPAVFSELQPKELPPEIANIELVMDVPLNITVELGRAKMSIQEVLELSPGAVVELDKIEGELVDILANGRLIAKGEVVVIGETFGVRIVEILSPQDRMKRVKD